MSAFSALTFKASVLLCMLSLYAERRKCQPVHYKNIAQKSEADFMQIDEMDIIYIIVYNSRTTIMPLRGAQSHFKRFSDQDVKSYCKEKYSVIHILYSFNIHCFNGKEL